MLSGSKSKYSSFALKDIVAREIIDFANQSPISSTDMTIK